MPLQMFTRQVEGTGLSWRASKNICQAFTFAVAVSETCSRKAGPPLDDVKCLQATPSQTVSQLAEEILRIYAPGSGLAILGAHTMDQNSS